MGREVIRTLYTERNCKEKFVSFSTKRKGRGEKEAGWRMGNYGIYPR